MIDAEQAPFKSTVRILSDIDRSDIVRQTLNEVETRINGISANHTYRQAFKVVVKMIRSMKP